MRKLNQAGFGNGGLKLCFRIFVISEYQNAPPELIESKEHNSNTCSEGKVLWVDISSS